MARTRGTNSRGGSFSAAEVQAVWNKGTAVSGYDASRWRKDACGAWMDRLEYGNTDSKQGWEVDHIRPVSHGGSDDLVNLQPLQWENNRGKGDSYPNWSCRVRAA
jgi:5-methylcytosine-specific restriction endonuclease McrA